MGGAPVRALRLAPAGTAALDAALSGRLPASGAAVRLLERLVDAGLAWPDLPPRPPAPGQVTIVIPVRDRPAGLRATLTALARASPGVAVLVVDDGSRDAACVRSLCDRFPGTGLWRRRQPGGPAAARNSGWRRATTPVVAFVDADCEPSCGWLDRLTPYLQGGDVAAVAPRVVSAGAGGHHRLAAYEAARSRLDMGDRPGPVRPGSWVGFVPTVALVASRAALAAVGGFDESLRTGEDVDLVWRLGAAGYRVRYQPTVTVDHPHRAGWGPWLAQRWAYGRSAAALAARHGRAVAPADVSVWSAGVWGLAAAGRPLAAATAAGATVAAAGWQARSTGLPAAMARLAAGGHLHAGLALARAVTGEWSPLVVWLAARRGPVASRARRLALVAAVAPAAAEWRTKRPGLGLAPWVGLRVADDLAYSAGVWAGCVEHRSGRALLPRVRAGSVAGRRRGAELGS